MLFGAESYRQIVSSHRGITEERTTSPVANPPRARALVIWHQSRRIPDEIYYAFANQGAVFDFGAISVALGRTKLIHSEPMFSQNNPPGV
jgi:hypothetical protein